MSVDLSAGVDIRLGEIKDLLQELRDCFGSYPLPQDWTTSADATTDTYTVLPLFPQVVNAGRIYDVRRIAISAAGSSGDPFTTLTSALACVFKNTSMSGKGSATQNAGFTTSALDGSPLLVVDTQGWDNAQAARVPCVKNWSRGGLTCKPGDQLFAVVKSAASGVHLAATVTVQNYPITAFLLP